MSGFGASSSTTNNNGGGGGDALTAYKCSFSILFVSNQTGDTGRETRKLCCLVALFMETQTHGSFEATNRLGAMW